MQKPIIRQTSYLCRQVDALFVVKDAEAKINEAVRTIVSRFRPDKIILFGSRARGDAQPDSDADLLVVMKVRGSRRRKASEIDLALARIGMPKDIILITPDEFKKYHDIVGTVVYPAVREGKVLYDCAA
jgi:predicted nucleotidyltransferase